MTDMDRDPASHSPGSGEGAGSRSSSFLGRGRNRGVKGKKGGKEKRQLPLWQESLLLMVVALVLAVVIKTFFLQAFYIPSASMEPGLVRNDRILVEKPSYWGDNGPERGDVVVFKDPGGWLGPAAQQAPNPLVTVMEKIGLYPSGGHLVKRVIGVGGDTISCCDKQGRLQVNGEPLAERGYIAKGNQCAGPAVNGCGRKWTYTVPEGRVFVMGDNRGNSADSSAHLCQAGANQGNTSCNNDNAAVPVDDVVGKVFVLVWPLDNARFMKRPATFEDIPDPS